MPGRTTSNPDIPAMEARYKGLTPIFHKFDAYGNKVSHAGINQ